MWMWILICLGLGALTFLALVALRHVLAKLRKRWLDLPSLPPGCG